MTQDRGPQLANVVYTLLTITWIAVLSRCYVRGRLTKSFGLDDWLAVASLILYTVYNSFVLVGVHYGTGRHFANLTQYDINHALKWWWACEVLYVAVTAVFKASICVFLLRICSKKIHTQVLYCILTLVMVYSSFYFFAVIWQCQPAPFFWTRFQGTHGKCLNVVWVKTATYAHSAVAAIADWTIGILPIFIVWNLQMNPRTKVSVAIILSLGALGSISTMVRVPYLATLLDTSDFLYATTDVAIWSTVEPGIGITCAAMACCRPLFRNFLSKTHFWGGKTTGKATSKKKDSKDSAWSHVSPRKRGYARNGSGSNKGREKKGSHGSESADGDVIMLDLKPVMSSAAAERHNKEKTTDMGITTIAEPSTTQDFPTQLTGNEDLELGAVGRVQRSASERNLVNRVSRWTMSNSRLVDRDDGASEDDIAIIHDEPPPPRPSIPSVPAAVAVRNKPRKSSNWHIGVMTTTEIRSEPAVMVPPRVPPKEGGEYLFRTDLA